jgi:hypothetical protein
MKRSFTIGDFARNIESGWIGQIVEILPPQEVKVNDTESFFETMARLRGVCTLCSMVTGETVIDDDDIQFHSVDDLEHAKLTCCHES